MVRVFQNETVNPEQDSNNPFISVFWFVVFHSSFFYSSLTNICGLRAISTSCSQHLGCCSQLPDSVLVLHRLGALLVPDEPPSVCSSRHGRTKQMEKGVFKQSNVC